MTVALAVVAALTLAVCGQRPSESNAGDTSKPILVGISFPPTGPHPAVLMLSGLDSAKEELRSVEETFLERGLACPARIFGPEL